MFRVVLRNVAVMLGVALPILLITALFVGWLSQSTPAAGPAGVKGAIHTLDGLIGGFEFMYMLWVLPAVSVAAVHQVLLAIPSRAWAAWKTRVFIVATSLAMAGLIFGYVVSNGTDHSGTLALTMLPPAVAYGLLARRLRSERR